MVQFNDSEKFDIRHFLGYPQVYRQANPRLESAIDIVSNDPIAADKVRALLLQLAAIQTTINDKDVKVAGLKSVDDKEVEWYGDASGNVALTGHLKQGNYLCSQLSVIMGVPIENRIFGTQGYTSDNWKQFSGTSTPGGYRSSFPFKLGWY